MSGYKIADSVFLGLIINSNVNQNTLYGIRIIYNGRVDPKGLESITYTISTRKRLTAATGHLTRAIYDKCF